MCSSVHEYRPVPEPEHRYCRMLYVCADTDVLVFAAGAAL